MLGYVNSIRTVDGGTHIDGVKASLTRTLNNLGKKMKIFKVRRALAFCALFFFLGTNVVKYFPFDFWLFICATNHLVVDIFID